MPEIALIAAVAENGVIGRAGGLPWRIPADLRYFKAQTLGKTVVMGRKTFASVGRPLPERKNIVVTRAADFQPSGVTIAQDLDAAIAAAGDGEIMVIGGGEIYAAALPRARRLYLTEVHASIAGDVRFPAIDRREWIEQSRERHHQEEPMPLSFSFVVLERRP